MQLNDSWCAHLEVDHPGTALGLNRGLLSDSPARTTELHYALESYSMPA